MEAIMCTHCHQVIPSGEDYYKDLDDEICLECLDSYILGKYDFCEIAEEFGMTKKTAPEAEREKVLPPLAGQLDMFGGVYGGPHTLEKA